MKRSALIIESSDVNGANDLPGARKDVKNWHKFLRREVAGAWDEFEITTMSKPRAETVINFVNQHKYDDYCMVIYTGHGAELIHGYTRQPHALLNEKDHLVDIKYLTPKTSKGILISDACRSSFNENSSGITSTLYGAMLTPTLCACIGGGIPSVKSIMSWGDKFKDFENIFMDDLITPFLPGDIQTTLVVNLLNPLGIRKLIRCTTRSQYADEFFKSLNSCPNGVTTIFSSSSGESSMDGAAGGAFLTALLIAVHQWKNSSNGGRVFNTYSAFKDAVHILREYNYAQNPEYSNPSVRFPIAVK